MLSGKQKQKFTEWWDSGKLYINQFLAQNKLNDQTNMIGLVITPQHLKLLKINRIDNQYTVEYLKVVELPDGLVANTEIHNCAAVAGILKDIFDHSNLNSKNCVFAIPRSSAIVKTISLDGRLLPEEIESRVWLEANRLFPNLIGDIYLDFVVTGKSDQDSSQIEVLVVACRKEQLKSYLDVMRMSGLNAAVVDVNYYAYERALSLISKQNPELKTIALLNISFALIDLLVVSEGKLVYTHEVSYDGHSLFKLLQDLQAKGHQGSGSAEAKEISTVVPGTDKINEILKSTIGLHLKHAMQFFYSSKPNTRLDRIILSGDTAAAIPEMLAFVHQELAKEVVLADPFKDMKIAANIDKDQLAHFAPALMLCCGLALTKLI